MDCWSCYPLTQRPEPKPRSRLTTGGPSGGRRDEMCRLLFRPAPCMRGRRRPELDLTFTDRVGRTFYPLVFFSSDLQFTNTLTENGSDSPSPVFTTPRYLTERCLSWNFLFFLPNLGRSGDGADQTFRSRPPFKRYGSGVHQNKSNPESNISPETLRQTQPEETLSYFVDLSLRKGIFLKLSFLFLCVFWLFSHLFSSFLPGLGKTQCSCYCLLILTVCLSLIFVFLSLKTVNVPSENVIIYCSVINLSYA